MNKIIWRPARWSATPTRWSSSSPGTAGYGYEQFAFMNRVFGQLWWSYAIMISCNVIIPQLFWFKKMRTSNFWDVHRLHLRERRDVVRAIRDRRHCRSIATSCRPRGALTSRPGLTWPDAARQLRPLLHAVPALHPLHADDRHRRGQGGDARGRPALRGLRPTTPEGRCPQKRHDATGGLIRCPRNKKRAHVFGACSPSSRTRRELYHAAEKVRDAGYTPVGLPQPVPGPRPRCRDGAESPRVLPWFVSSAPPAPALVDGDAECRTGPSTRDRLPASSSPAKPYFSIPAQMPDRVRADGALQCVDRLRDGMLRPSTVCRSSSTRPSRVSASAASPTTASSSRSKRTISTSTSKRPTSCCAMRAVRTSSRLEELEDVPPISNCRVG